MSAKENKKGCGAKKPPQTSESGETIGELKQKVAELNDRLSLATLQYMEQKDKVRLLERALAAALDAYDARK
jgi:hypothetical protein